jgi:preprotein translocase subunit SecB
MSDTQPAQSTETAVQLTVNGQYVKDLSFEVPNAPAIFSELSKAAPEIPIGIDIEAQQIGEHAFEVVLKVNIEAKVAGKAAFIAELSYAGIFTIDGVAHEHLQPLLLIECPRLLFPFARNIIADMTRDGGFPPLMMQPIDFVALYRQRMAQGGNGQATA